MVQTDRQAVVQTGMQTVVKTGRQAGSGTKAGWLRYPLTDRKAG